MVLKERQLKIFVSDLQMLNIDYCSLKESGKSIIIYNFAYIVRIIGDNMLTLSYIKRS